MNFHELDCFMELYPERNIPGADLKITKDGETIYRKTVGFADEKKERPLKGDEIYWVYSISKITTCVCAMRLVERGLLGLDDPVSRYIPEFSSLTVKKKDGTVVPAENELKIIHLFLMTGGFSYETKVQPIADARKNPNASTLDIVRSFASVPLLSEPGEEYHYSLCHDILAAVVEVVSGMRYSEYFEKYVGQPLNMKDTGFRLPPEKAERMGDMFVYDNGNLVSNKRKCDNMYMLSAQYDSGGAGLFSTVDDQSNLMTVLATGGRTKDGYELLKPETVKLFQKPMLSFNARKSYGLTRLYGYSWGLCGRVHTNPVTSFSLSSVGEFGWDGATGGYALIDPEKRLAVFLGMHVMSCTYAYNILHPAMRNLIYKGLM